METRISESAFYEVEEAFKLYAEEVNSSDLTPTTRHLYTYRAQLFLRWMRYDFTPGEGLSVAEARARAKAKAEAESEAAKAEMDVEAKVWARFWDEGWAEDEAFTRYQPTGGMGGGDERLVDAIKQPRLILIEYFPGIRLIEPYAYGQHRNGNEHLVAWQTRGASASGQYKGWKTFMVDEIEQLEVLAETFDGVRRDYNASRPVPGAKRVYAYYWPKRD